MTWVWKEIVRGRSWMMICMALWFGCWGAFMLAAPPTGKDASGGAAWNVYVNVLGCGFWGHWMVMGAILAFWGMAISHKSWSVLLLMPLLFASMVGFMGVFTTYFGVWHEFATSRALRSSLPALITFPCHLGAMWDHWGLRRRR